ncbi:hypothetical protein SFUMM280S_01408 [Streptomyces fumanus]
MPSGVSSRDASPSRASALSGAGAREERRAAIPAWSRTTAAAGTSQGCRFASSVSSGASSTARDDGTQRAFRPVGRSCTGVGEGLSTGAVRWSGARNRTSPVTVSLSRQLQGWWPSQNRCQASP